MNDTAYQELIDLANAHIEGKLDPEPRTRLESILVDDESARRIFVDFMHDHAALHWDQIGENEDSIVDFPLSESTSKSGGRWLAAAAAVVVSGVVFFMFGSKTNGGNESFAVMEKTSAARWESGNLPTSEGSRLGSGTLRLAEGLATLRFDSGAEVILEAPAEIELIDEMNCELARGTLVADIPDSAIGFRIETPAANVVDYGTRFAVNVDGSTGATRTQVFEGLVEVEHPESGEIVELKTGEGNFVAGDSISKAAKTPDEGDWSHASAPVRRGPDWSLIQTSRDAYVYSTKIANHMSDEMLLLKNSSDERGPHRKTYLGFDLSKIDPTKLTEAELILNFTPTGWGLASSVSDSEFTVYGVTGEREDDWTYRSMTWQNAPANIMNTGDTLKTGQAKKLGTFSIAQGIQLGQFGISGDSLVEFLRSESDQNVTLVVVRNTQETEGGGLVHGIASRRHPALPAPTLAVRVSD